MFAISGSNRKGFIPRSEYKFYPSITADLNPSILFDSAISPSVRSAYRQSLHLLLPIILFHWHSKVSVILRIGQTWTTRNTRGGTRCFDRVSTSRTCKILTLTETAKTSARSTYLSVALLGLEIRSTYCHILHHLGDINKVIMKYCYIKIE